MKILAVLAIFAAIWWLARRRQVPMSAGDARDLLGLPAQADAAAINAAHRRLIARVHPDAGGSAALAARVNAARDVLIADLRTPSRPS